ncbi:hypothetical protein [Streptomyces sp. NBC_01601]|uniref:hypothetical protein n=1 Tax=Streptomyces sp. NBC_01601 TaxID=2975892 RepID=UPI002E2BACAA|nr:hypothetical protein [Streptomyces sp. NBC_01601]
MHEQQQQFAPWGTVTSTYWHIGQPEQPAQAAHVSQVQEAVPVKAEEPQATPAPQPEQLVQAAPVPQAREALPAKAEEAQPGPAPAPQAREEAAREPEPVHRPDAGQQPEAQGQASDQSPVPEAGQGGPPAEYQARISAIVASFDAPDDAARLAAAAVDAEQLDQAFTAQYGQQHPHTINLRELRGWLAYLQGQMGTAARWYLHTTGLQAQVWGSGHQVTQGSVQRAVHIWLSIPDAQESLAVGQELLAMLAAVTGEDSGLSRKVRSRLESMGAQGGA